MKFYLDSSYSLKLENTKVMLWFVKYEEFNLCMKGASKTKRLGYGDRYRDSESG